jgi:hypothetical protein
MYSRKYLLLTLIVIWLLNACSSLEAGTEGALTSNSTPNILTAAQGASVTLTADRLELNPGEPITLSWTSTGCEGCQAQIMLISDGSTTGTVQTWNDLPSTGSLQTTIRDGDLRDQYRFMLILPGASDSIVVRFPCRDTFFFDQKLIPETVCPASEATYPQAVEQVFEGGRMLWLQSDNQIYVLYGDGDLAKWWESPLDIFENSWSADEPESDSTLTPPPGFYQPLRELGKVWRGDAIPISAQSDQVVRDKLGWALSPEQAFTSAVQREWVTCVMRQECSDITPYDYIRLSDGRTVKLGTNLSHGGRPFWGYLAP